MTTPQIPVCVLVVDDDAEIRSSVARLLADGVPHARVLVADSAMKARDVLSHEPVDVVVSDFSMPGENGISLLSSVAKSHPAIRRVLHTGAPPDVLPPVLNACLVKPARQDELLAAVFGPPSLG